MLPSLSIVIPTHQRTDLLARCLASVVRFAPPATEIIVVDDASPQAQAAKAAQSFANVTVVALAQQLGFCGAANAGIATSRGTIVELLNDDTEVTFGWATAALARFADPTVGAVAPLVLQSQEGKSTDRIDSAGDRYFLGGVAGKRGHGRALGLAYLTPREVFGASGSSAFYRREALLRVGAFPASFRAYFEDVDLSFRLRRAGYSIHFEPASRVYHRVGSSHRKADRSLLEQQSRNEERVYWRNLPTPTIVCSLPLHACVLLAKAWRRWDEGSLAPFLRGRLHVLSEVSAVMRHRRWLALALPRNPPVRVKTQTIADTIEPRSTWSLR